MKKKVAIIGMDGLRADTIKVANTPNLDVLMANGIYSYNAITEEDSVSGVCWTSLLKGVHKAKHRINGNDFSNQDLSYKTIFYLAERWNPSIRSIAHSQWPPILTKIFEPRLLKRRSFGREKVMAHRLARDIRKDRADLYFAQLDDCDHAGHKYGYSPDNSKYVEQVEKTDLNIGKISRAISERPQDEDWLICAVSDHGGNGKSHGGQSKGELNIAFIISGNSVKNKGEIPANIQPKIVDFVPTIAIFLEMPIESAWDGTVQVTF